MYRGQWRRMEDLWLAFCLTCVFDLRNAVKVPLTYSYIYLVIGLIYTLALIDRVYITLIAQQFYANLLWAKKSILLGGIIAVTSFLLSE